MAKSNGKFTAGMGLVLLVAAAIGVYNYFNAEPSELGASLVLVDGTVEMFSDHGWEGAKEDARVQIGDKIRTTEGKAVISTDDGSALRLDGDTEVEVVTLTRDHIAFELNNGRVYSRVDKTSGLTWDVIALDTTSTALGTAYVVEADASKKHVAVSVVESKVQVEVTEGEDSVEQTVTEGSGLDIDLNQTLEDATTFSALDTSDAASDAFLVWNVEEDSGMDERLGVLSALAGETPRITEKTFDDSNEDADTGVEASEDADVIDGAADEDIVDDAITSDEDTSDDDGDDSTDTESETEADVKEGEGDEGNDKETPSEDDTSTGGYIGLSGEATDKGVYFTWALSDGLEAPKGFKVVKSVEANPVYPGDAYKYLSDPDTRTYTWDLSDGETYHFRVCIYTGDGCSVYSNDVIVTAPETSGKDDAISFISGELDLTGVAKESGIKLTWTQSTATEFKYYKLVRSETDTNPYYPKTGALSYFSDQATTSYVDTNVKDGTTYYYRVCSVETSGSVSCGNVTEVAY